MVLEVMHVTVMETLKIVLVNAVAVPWKMNAAYVVVTGLHVYRFS
jgi:hypothetical protein